ncbi:MAG TPA: FAD-binding oxidoreductase [Ilumatobacter sp.]|nr:FAD-binding oxidoreductase [Ilumatobacter sp.]
MALLTGRREALAGWGQAVRSVAEVIDVDTVDADTVAAAVRGAGSRGAIARGLGRSYGDPAQNAGGRVLACAGTRTAGAIVLDAVAGTATVSAGVSIADLLEVIVPQGWFVPVTPGTRFVTIGGAIASDIHGKNHHQSDDFGGSFGNHVTSLRLVLADASVVDVGPDRDPELFWATVGGMGLTGVIVSATFRLIPIETAKMAVDTYRIGDLDELMARMSDTEATMRYSVAWLDLLAAGRHLGRGVLTNGEHATRTQVGGSADPLAYQARQLVGVPRVVPPAGVINGLTVRAFNELWYRKAPRCREAELQSIPAYFHPLDLVRDWNRVYGKRGFLQYQFLVPHGEEATLRTVIEQISAARVPTFLTVLKRFGPGNPAPLSFPTGGWTLAIDVATTYRELAPLLRRLDALVLDAGGRHYLAKDCHMSPDALRRGYPRLDEWRAVRDRVDPSGVWASDQSRRLGLTD